MSQSFVRSPFRQFRESPFHQRNSTARRITPCQRIQCLAAVPLNGLSPFPGWLRGIVTYSNGDDTSVRDALLAKTGFIFAVESSLDPSFAGIAILPCPFGGDNSLTRYHSVGFAYNTYFRDDVTGNVETFNMAAAAVFHSKAYFTGVESAGASPNGKSINASISSSSPNITTGEYWSKSIADNGTLTEVGPTGPSFPGGSAFFHMDWITFVETYTGASITVAVTATLATVTIHAPEAAVEAELGVDITGGLDVVATVSLGDPHDIEETLAQAETLLEIFELTLPAKTYEDQEFSNILSFGNKYLARYEGPEDGAALRVVISATATPDNFPYAAREWLGAGTFSAPLPHDLSDLTFLIGDAGLMKCAKARGGRVNQTATLHSEEWTQPRLSTDSDDYIGGDVQGHYGGSTDCIPWIHGQSEYVDLADLISHYGRATIQRTCAGDTLCTP